MDVRKLGSRLQDSRSAWTALELAVSERSDVQESGSGLAWSRTDAGNATSPLTWFMGRTARSSRQRKRSATPEPLNGRLALCQARHGHGGLDAGPGVHPHRCWAHEFALGDGLHSRRGTQDAEHESGPRRIALPVLGCRFGCICQHPRLSSSHWCFSAVTRCSCRRGKTPLTPFGLSDARKNYGRSHYCKVRLS